jgi:hypothetical protein
LKKKKKTNFLMQTSKKYANLLFCKFFLIFVYSQKLVKVYMECYYTHLNHNSLVSQEKVVTKWILIKGVYCIQVTALICQLYHHLFQLWWVVWLYKSKCSKPKLILFKSWQYYCVKAILMSPLKIPCKSKLKART